MAAFVTELVERDGPRLLALDIFAPGEGANGGSVILLHGGAWRFGDRRMVHPYGEILAEHGFLAVCAEYRLVGEAPWPAQIDDVVAVVNWVAANAVKLGVHPDKIAVEGFSAGGHLALIAGAQSASVAAVVAFFAPPRMVHDTPRPGPDPKIMLLGPEADADTVAQASPIARITSNFPPTFLLGGTDDPLVTPADMVAMFEALRAQSVTAELHLFSGHTHEFSALPSMLAPVQAEVSLFLQRNLIDPAFYATENRELNMFARPGGPPIPPPGP